MISDKQIFCLFVFSFYSKIFTKTTTKRFTFVCVCMGKVFQNKKIFRFVWLSNRTIYPFEFFVFFFENLDPETFSIIYLSIDYLFNVVNDVCKLIDSRYHHYRHYWSLLVLVKQALFHHLMRSNWNLKHLVCWPIFFCCYCFWFRSETSV